MKNDTTHFGYQSVAESEKARKVADVFDSVAQRYDLMNDLMSGGMHRLWKAFTIQRSGVREGSRVLDVAGGTGDVSLAFAKRVGKSGQVWLTDINNAMLARGRDRLLDKGYMLPVAQCDAEKLPFPDDWFDVVTVAFGLRNMTHKDLALAEMRRVLRPGVCYLRRLWVVRSCRLIGRCNAHGGDRGRGVSPRNRLVEQIQPLAPASPASQARNGRQSYGLRRWHQHH